MFELEYQHSYGSAIYLPSISVFKIKLKKLFSKT